MLTLLAVVCPPLAVLVTGGSRSQAAKNAALTMLLYVPGVIHAWNAVEKRHVERQYESVFEAMDRAGMAA